MIKLIATVGLVGAAVYGLAFGAQNFLSIDDLKNCPAPNIASSTCAPADAIVAISGGDTQARALEAIKLYLAGWAPRLIFSGAALDTSGPSNAEAMRSQAMRAGVPANVITLDTNAVDTAQNARNASTLLQNAHRVILVTSPYHQHRAAVEFAKFFGNGVAIINHPTSTDHLWPQYWWLTLTGWWLAITESIKTLVVML
jgi:uncharacterized SAM-binding protein YcdF (DUF218 family)